MVDDRLPEPIEGGGEPPLRDCHPDGVSKALAEGPGSDFDASSDSPFGVTGCPAAPPPEVLEIVEGEPVPCQEQKAVQQHASVPRREHEPVAVDPLWVRRVASEVTRPEDIGHRRGAHRHPRMSRRRLFDCIDAERPDRVDADFVNGAAWRRHLALPFRDFMYRCINAVVELSWPPAGGPLPCSSAPTRCASSFPSSTPH